MQELEKRGLRQHPLILGGAEQERAEERSTVLLGSTQLVLVRPLVRSPPRPLLLLSLVLVQHTHSILSHHYSTASTPTVLLPLRSSTAATATGGCTPGSQAVGGRERVLSYYQVLVVVVVQYGSSRSTTTSRSCVVLQQYQRATSSTVAAPRSFSTSEDDFFKNFY